MWRRKSHWWVYKYAATNKKITSLAQFDTLSKLFIIFGSLRTADAFPVVATLPPKNRERSDDRKRVCCSQAKLMAASKPKTIINLI